MNRRQLLAAAGAAGVASVVSTPTPAKAWVIEALQIASAAASVCAAFTNGGDGGLGAYLSSIRDLQLQALDQLAAVRRQLEGLHQRIDKLRDEVEGLIDRSRIDAYQARFFGVYDEYRERLKARTNENPTPRELERRDQLEARLRERVVLHRQELKNEPKFGSSPHAVLLASFLLPIEMDARFLQEDERPVLLEALSHYDEWRAAMLDSTRVGSAAHYLDYWLAESERRADAVKAHRFGSLADSPGRAIAMHSACFAYEEFKPAETKRVNRGSCGREKRDDCGWQDVDYPEHIGTSSSIERSLTVIEDQSSGFRRLILSRGETAAPSFSRILAPHCEVQRHGFSGDIEGRYRVLRSSEGYKRRLEIENSFEVLIEQLNVARAHVLFGATAIVVAEGLRDEIKRARMTYA